ncbi:MAG TPA: hypothetical protein VG798_03705 [Rhizomicrobium sp.]|nr:hypothetical protein [Rhizomicrobium sp.]
MANPEVVDLMQAQLKRDRYVIRDAARQLGTNIAATPDVRTLMADRGIDKVECGDFLANSIVVEIFPMLGVIRHRVEKEDPDDDDRIVSMTVFLHTDSMTIEMISFRTKEA